MQLELLHNTTVLIECDLGDYELLYKCMPKEKAWLQDFKFYEHIKN